MELSPTYQLCTCEKQCLPKVVAYQKLNVLPKCILETMLESSISIEASIVLSSVINGKNFLILVLTAKCQN
jgi:hypothetical protein